MWHHHKAPDKNCSKCHDAAYCRFTDESRQQTQCVCSSMRDGEFCEIDLCSHCQNRGRCRISEFINDTECICHSPFYGEQCQLSKLGFK